MTDPLDITTLMDWLEGRLTEDEAKAVAARVEADASHQATITWLRDFLSLSTSTVLIDPPAELVWQTLANFRAFMRDKRQEGWLQRLVATLAFDSWQRSSLAGVRRTGLDPAPRQLVYKTDTADIALNTRPGRAEDMVDLFGQIFPRDEADPASFTVQLMRHEAASALSFANHVGKFICTGLQADVYSIIIRGDEVEIVVSDVDLTI